MPESLPQKPPKSLIFVLTLPFLLRFPSYQSTAALRAKSTTSFLSLLVTESAPLQCWQYGLLHDPRHRWNRNGIAKSILNLRLFKTLQVKVVCALQSCVFQPGHPAHTYFPLADKHDSLLGGTAPGGTQQPEISSSRISQTGFPALVRRYAVRATISFAFLRCSNRSR